ncbi:MAG TPA: hypothetical protein VMW56_08710 [Candidatus Margulisiibacteriota bacterium]|nr:hypothetical protein [Candidatus Margulisiibacteriota bacterium]
MKRWHLAWVGGALFGAACAAAVAAAEAPVSPQEAGQVVAVTDLNVESGIVSASLVNRSPHEVRDVRLLIRHAWVWRDERHPGKDTPGTAEYYIVHNTIPPGQSLRITQTPSPPLPQRSDGHFETSVEVAGFEEVGE